MYIKLFLIISIISCNDKKLDHNYKPIQEKKEIIKRQEKENGFIVLKNSYNGKDILKIYNSNQSVWKSFRFNDNFKDDEINPFAIKPENILLVFKYLGKENGFYKILTNENKNTIKYIKQSDINFKFQTIEEHILSVFSVEFNEKENPLKLEPNAEAKSFPTNKDSNYYPIKINKNWLMVEDDYQKKYWIKWCDDKGNLILNLYYDA